MATSELFAGYDPAGDDSDDSFIAPSQDGSEVYDAPINADADDGESDLEFLFGQEKPDDSKKTKKKSRSKWEKELDRRLREASSHYGDVDNIELDIKQRIDQLYEYSERRQSVESEILALFSGLLTREQFTVETAPTQENVSSAMPMDNTLHSSSEVDRAMDKVMKKLIRQTFRGRNPEGRFGPLGASEETRPSGTQTKVNTIINISNEALANMQDLNTLLHREREGDYVELDGVPLYKHTRYGTLYIIESGLMVTHILPLCSKLMQESSTMENNINPIIQEVIYLLYQLSQPPSEAWYNYWREAQPHYRALAVSQQYDHDAVISTELKRRSGIIGQYIHGLVSLRTAMLSSDLWTLVGEFRVNLENFKISGYRTAEQNQHVAMLKHRQNALANERDALIAEGEDSDDNSEENAVGGRLRREHSANETRKRRIQELRTQLYEVNEELAKERQAHMEAEQQTRLHCKTIRLLISNILAVPGDGLSLLSLLQESGLMSVLREEVIACFKQCHRAFTVSDSGDIIPHPAYINEGQRETIWDHLRLVHSILVSIDIGRFLSMSYAGVYTEQMQMNDLLLRSAEGQTSRKVDNDALVDLIRLNPKLARLRLKNPSKVPGFIINERFGGTRSQQSYGHLFCFPALIHLDTPFDISQGDVSKGQNTYHPTLPLSASVLLSLQGELHKIIGIDSDFEYCHWPDLDSDNSIYYELGVVLSLCFADLMREAEDRYFQSTDYQLLLDLHSWVVTYYRCLYSYISEKSKMEGKQAPPESYLLLVLRRYVGGDSLCAKISCEYLWKLIRKHSLSKSTHFGATSALRALYATLVLIDMFQDVGDNLAIMRICQDTLSMYLSGDIRSAIFWILRNFKLLAHPGNLFWFAISNLHMFRKVMRHIGSVTFTVDKVTSESMAYGGDSDVTDDEAPRTKTIIVTYESIFSSRNRNTTNDDILFNGRVIYNCVAMLANFRTNSAYLNDMLVSHIEILPIPLLYDVKYLYVFSDIAMDSNVWRNARLRWVGDLCVHLMESFFDSWLGRGNRFLPGEIFFNKSSSSIRGPFRPTAPDNIVPISRGYIHSDLLNEFIRRPGATVFEVSKDIHDIKIGATWDPSDDPILIKYYKQFHYLDDPVEFISELLGCRTFEVNRRLRELKLIGVDSPSTGTNEKLRQILERLVSKFNEEAIKVISELQENINEAIEMQRLGGLDSVCQVMEPFSASSHMLDSSEFKDLINILGLSHDWVLPKDISSLSMQLPVLLDTDSYTGGSHTQTKQRFSSVHGPSDGKPDTNLSESREDEDIHPDIDMYAPSVVSSRDIARLLLHILEELHKHNEIIAIGDIIIEALALVESATVIGTAQSLCNSLPQNESCLNKLRALLLVAGVYVEPPMLRCTAMLNQVIATDRLQVALNLSRLPLHRLRDIVRQEIRSKEDLRRLGRTVGNSEGDINGSYDMNMAGYNDPMEEYLDIGTSPNFKLPNRYTRKRRGRGGMVLSDTTHGRKFLNKGYGIDDEQDILDSASTTIEQHGAELQLVVDEVYRCISSGKLRIDAEDLMSVAEDHNCEVSYTTIRNICKSIGAIEEREKDKLWLVWAPEAAESAIAACIETFTMIPNVHGRFGGPSPNAFGVLSERDHLSVDNTPLRRLDVDTSLVSSIYEESLTLAREGRLRNKLKTRGDLQRLLG
ncbi:uncharacterized protein BBOV_IV002790 [Babesia bovis T2Bo]|uniref:Uncharacterized protein n=1 Tax=Babesia bovis TaxID=5865 RepID=A7AVQ0_BABBO|nr:uncharacterized protein BBOV_IV002790 [Babesia bovis T2Bo]EDO05876.1 hypothetical protein BBOV_IV002790 [Babesia bovis T2Bo]|eukprot:XP_001609444.1 hypothetical protein [Babesia bovis T2Bo]